MGRTIGNEKGRPAGKDSRFTCAAMIAYGKDVEKGLELEDVASGEKSAPLSTELNTGVIIAAGIGGNPNRGMEVGE